MFVLEVRTHGNLALESSVTDGAMIRQALRMCREMFRQVILSKESFLADATFIRLDTGVSHFVAAHVRSI